MKFIIDATMRLHNLLVDYRESLNSTDADSDDDMDWYHSECLSFMMSSNPEEIVGTYGNGTVGIGIRGRPTNKDRLQRDKGIQLRNQLRGMFNANGMKRPKQNGKWIPTHSRNLCNHAFTQ